MRKIIYSFLIVVLMLMLTRTVNAQMGNMIGGTSDVDMDVNLATVISQLLTKYNADKIQNLDCSQISDDDLEELGDSVMSQMHPDQEVHEQMDAMMGGEGSESLRQAHINMALNYMGCGSGGCEMMSGGRGGSYNGMGMLGLSKTEDMGQGMPMWGRFGLFSSGIHKILASVTWLALIAFLVSGTIYFWRKGKKHGK